MRPFVLRKRNISIVSLQQLMAYRNDNGVLKPLSLC
jgi:hypothetical protein